MRNISKYQLQQKVVHTLRKMNYASGDPLLVAVSGGSDSMALLHILWNIRAELNHPLIVCHFNHGLRGEASDGDEVFVRNKAAELELLYESGYADVTEAASESGESTEASARRLRYGWLKSVAAKHRACAVLLGHHADDQMETVFWRLIRGSGIDGLSGMQEISNRDDMLYIRPLLSVTKAELTDYCETYAIAFREDGSNASVEYTRNAIRAKLIPIIREFNPNAAQTIARTTEILSDEDQWMQQMAEDWVQKHVVISSEQQVFSWARADFLSCPVALQRRLIKLILSYLSPDMDQYSFNRLEAIRALILNADYPNKTLPLADQLSICRSYERIEAGYLLHTDIYDYEYAWNPEALPSIAVPAIQARLESCRISSAEAASARSGKRNTDELIVNLLAYPAGFVVRNRRRGDAIRIPGMTGRKKLKELWIDIRCPKAERDQWPLLVSQDNQILWIPGIRNSSDVESVYTTDAQWVRIKWVKE